MSRHTLFLAFAILVLSLGCGSSSSPSDPGGGDSGDGEGPPPLNLTGTFMGVVSGYSYGDPFSMTVTFTMIQNGDEVTCTWTSSGNSSGTGSGTITGQVINPFRIYQIEPCTGEFVGVADIMSNGDALEGSYSGNDCYGYVTASFSVARI